MKNSWLVWVFIVGMVVTILIAFNYQGAQETIPLSEIFPDTVTNAVEIEYVDDQIAQSGKSEDTVPSAKETTNNFAATAKEEVSKSSTATIEPIAKEVKKTVEKVQAPAASKDSKYTIQVASYKDKINAERKVSELEKKDYKAYIVSKELFGKGTWYRVNVGGFSTKKEADEFLTNIKKDYSGSFVILIK
ncbi:MAG: SPOR domain-containing protein [Candidatus Omnitrophica bacterium]|nr:SPOR domain-containing protein [Candidatus Omnitrophota bacterium]